MSRRTATARATGRLVSNCPHLVGWTRTGGESRCDRCGTRRFEDYAALRPSGLPAAVTPSPAARRAADRNAAAAMATASSRRRPALTLTPM
ncbi:DUF6255 family natural product biosynthesis protein [Streptomyces sp. NPDC053079]|uniref:DUF6255 family natural product biosynthesis protein n=1 Tax=Streptomyces sp. NPDC053079 TaxID=3365697 RepID=UPI0037D5AEF7